MLWPMVCAVARRIALQRCPSMSTRSTGSSLRVALRQAAPPKPEGGAEVGSSTCSERQGGERSECAVRTVAGAAVKRGVSQQGSTAAERGVHTACEQLVSEVFSQVNSSRM